MRFVLAMLLLVLLPGCAEMRVQGLVRDLETGAPLKGATVVIGHLRATVDDSGGFELIAPCAQQVRASVEARGYHSFVKWVRIWPDPGVSVVTLDFELVQRGYRGGGVNVNVNQNVNQNSNY